MNAKELFPIGTVVLLRNGKKPLMIMGYLQQDTNNRSITYDYSGVFYPEGNIGPQYHFLFNHSDVVNVLHLGMDCQERIDFVEKIYAQHAQEQKQ